MKERISSFIETDGALWLKGNTHCHSCFSDGRLTPEELKDAYKSHGYDFLAVTDHDFYTDTRALSDLDFTMLQGFELFGFAGSGKSIHINFLWDGTPAGLSPNSRVSLSEKTGEASLAFCRRLRAEGAYCMLNHPRWSVLESAEIEDDNPYHAVEIFNYSSEWLERTGNSQSFWAEMLYRGVPLWGGGTDDNHNHAPIDSLDCDSFGGFTVVRACDRSPAAILDALKRGSFYTSAGPSIYDFYVEDGDAHLLCSPCERIYLIGEQYCRSSRRGRYLTEFSAKLREDQKFIRAEVVDAAGRIAYSNPIFLR